MKRTLPIDEALELTIDIPEVHAVLQDRLLEGHTTVEISIEDDGIRVLPISKVDVSGPTSDSVHVPTTEWRKKPSYLSKAVVEEERYTFSPWYVPDVLDAHGEWSDPREIQHAFWNYLSNEDREIRLQHNMDIVAGKWVEGATWPYEVTVPVKHPEGETEYTFPAGTPFLGIIWEPWAWELIKAGDIRGLSIGGTAQRAEMELSKLDYNLTGSVEFAKMIQEVDGKFILFSQDGDKHLGTFDSEEEALEREAEINRIKHMTKAAPFISVGELTEAVEFAKDAFMMTEPTKEGLAAELSDLLGDVVAFKFIAQGFYWNVVGADFPQYQSLFAEIYEQSEDSIDVVAENIRKLNFDAPFRLTDFMGEVASLEIPDTNQPVTMSKILYIANEQVRGAIVTALSLAYAINEQGIIYNLSELQDEHGKWQWQLRSIVGDVFADAYEVDVDEIGTLLQLNFVKHLSGRHDQSSHARGSGKFPKVRDLPADATRNPKAVASAIALRSAASKVDEQVSGEMLAIAGANGGQLQGLENRLKSTDSLARKIEADANAEYGGDIDKAASNIGDVSRYTVTYGEQDYTKNVTKTLETLEQNGYEVAKIKNYWGADDPYQGINVKIKKDGITRELQIHTEKSHEVKITRLHPIYEEYRSPNITPAAKASLWSTMVAASATIPTPAEFDTLLSIGEIVG